MSSMIQATTAPSTVQVIERKVPGYMKLYGDVLTQYLSLQTPQALEAIKPQLTARQLVGLEYWASKLQAGETPKQQHVSNAINSAWPVNYGSQQTENLMWGLTHKLLKKAPIRILPHDQLNSLYVSFRIEDFNDQVLVRDSIWDHIAFEVKYVTLFTYRRVGDWVQLVIA